MMLAFLLAGIGAFSGMHAQSVNKQKLLDLVAYSDSLFADEVMAICKGEEILYWKGPTCATSTVSWLPNGRSPTAER